MRSVVSAEQMCLRLRKATSPKVRVRLLEQATGRADCLAYALEQARVTQPTDPGTALAWSDLAIELADGRQDSRATASSWRARAQSLRKLGRYNDAIDAHRAAAERARVSGDDRLAAEVRLGEIDSLDMLGRSDEALALAKRLETDLRGVGAPAEAAKALANAGNVYFRRDQYPQALDCYARAQATLTDSGDEVAAARLQANTAHMLSQMNRVDEAILLNEQAREVFTRRDLPVMAAMVDVNVGALRYVSGELSAALAVLTRARREFEVRGLDLEVAKCDADIADVYRELNLGSEALECYQRAIPLFERLGLVYEQARAEMGRASILMNVDRVADAFQALDTASGLFRRQRNGLMRAQVQLMRAYGLRAAGRVEEAVVEARAAALALARRNAPASAASARFLIAELGLQAGKDMSRRLLAVSRTARRHARGWLVSRAERALGVHYAGRGDTRRAIIHFRAGVAALEEARSLIASEDLHLAFLRDKLAVYEDLAGALLVRNGPEDVAEALDCVERAKSRLLLERIQSVLNGGATFTASSPARERLAALRAELSRAYRSLYADEVGASTRLTGGAITLEGLVALEQAYVRALRDQEATSLEQGDATAGLTLAKPCPADRLCGALGPDEILVEYYTVGDTVGAFVLTHDALHVRHNIARLSDVAPLARRLRHQLQRVELESDYVLSRKSQMVAGIEGVLRELHTLLISPLCHLLNHERIVVIPHGILHGLPFHAFHDGVDYALSRHEFVYVPSAAIWYAGVMRQRSVKPNSAHRADCNERFEMAAFAVPETRIAHVAEEVDRIAELFPGACAFHGEEATIASFRSVASRARRIHLATHAVFRADNPLFSGLRFSDGWLLAHDLYDIPLDCDLATLSACRTGASSMGPGDELLGLTRSFLAAGARSVAASLWPADDAATASLMVRFYELMTGGASRAAALRAAQLETRAQYAHPYYWAPFVLVGER